MRILAMDTATSAITVAVHDGETVLAARATIDARRHTELLAPLVLEALAAASTTAGEITHVAVGTGPGPFTGLRVGLVTAHTFAHARGITVHGVCSLDALAAAAAQRGHEGDLLVATDARRKEVYWARYRCAAGQASALDQPTVTKPADLPDTVRALPLEKFFLDYGTQDRAKGELVASVSVPKLKAGQHFRAYKISKRFDQDSLADPFAAPLFVNTLEKGAPGRLIGPGG